MKELEEKIVSQAWTNQDILENFRTLCLQYRGRFSGSPEGLAAADFIHGKLNDYGLTHVEKQPFTKTNWRRGTVTFEIIDPVQVTLPCITLPYAPSCSRKFELLDLEMGLPGTIQQAGETLKDKAVLVDDINPVEGPHLHRLQKYVDALQAGAGAFLFVNNSEGMLAPTGTLAFHHDKSLDQAIPSIGIAREVGCELRNWLEKGPVRIRLTMDNTLERGEDYNVLGDIPGTQNDNRYLVLCGHYDGHDIAQAAFDNASGTAVVLEVARILSPLRAHLKRTIRFILFGSEEMGLVGSHYYVRHSKSELDNVLFVMNLDCVGAASDPVIWLQNAEQWEPVLNECVREIGAPITVEDRLVPFSDHFPFMMQGIPGAFCYTPMSGGRGWGHTIADTHEKVSGAVLQKMAMYLGRIMFRMANLKKLPERRKPPAEVFKAIEDRYLENMMRYEGHWPF